MKRKTQIVLTIALCLLLLTSFSGRISGEKAIDIALNDLGIDRISTTRTDAKLDKTGETPVYNVDINRNDRTEKYVIDAKTGEILSKETVNNLAP